ERIGGANAAQIVFERRMKNSPVRASIGGEEDGSGATHDPAHLVQRSRASGQINQHIAGLPRPRGAAIIGEFDHAGMTGAPEGLLVPRGNHMRTDCPGEFERKTDFESGRCSRWKRRSSANGRCPRESYQTEIRSSLWRL